MPRLIDANDVIDEINEAISNIAFTSPYQSDINTMLSGMERVLDIVEASPTVDAVEVVHGRWEKFHHGSYDFALRLRCSHCRHVVYEWGFNYCPNCGAKMDGDGNA